MTRATAGVTGRSRRTKRRCRRRLGVACVLAIPLFTLPFCVGSPAYYADKLAAAGEARPIYSFPAPLVPEWQVEPHTCGLHAMSSIYRAYGLDPLTQRLRVRLGVDTPLTFLAPDTTGTIHPDLLRVLSQDGFSAELLRPTAENTLARVRAHLGAGHPALAVVRVKELHWVALAALEDPDTVVICDSLRETRYAEDLVRYLHDRVLSIILVRPRPPAG